MTPNIDRAKKIEGFMTELELTWLAKEASNHKCIVEIGSYLGRSTVALAENTEGQVYAFDNWKGIQESHLPVDTRENLYNVFMQNVNGLMESGKVIPWIIDHKDVGEFVISKLRITPDMVFIDGCHEYEKVKRDIEMALTYVSKDGIICGHDANWGGVNKSVRELLPNAKSISNTAIWKCDVKDIGKPVAKINNGIDNRFTPDIGLIIAIPFGGRPVTPGWAIALAAQNFPLNLSHSFHLVMEKSADVAREMAVDTAIEKKTNYILFLDDDVQLPLTGIRQLIYTLEQAPDDVMAVTGIYTSKFNPPEPLVYRGVGRGAFWKWKAGDVFEVDGAGLGCMLVKTEVFSKIDKPYFKITDDPTRKGEVISNAGTEDIYFCSKLRSAGYKILADSKVMCIHWDVRSMTGYQLNTDSYPMIKESSE